MLRVQAVRVADDIRILKAANDVHNRLALADVGEELVAQALAVARALDQAGDIDELDDGRGRLLRVIHGGKLIQPLIRYSDNAGVRLDGGERVVFRKHVVAGQCIEHGGLADVRQSDDSDSKRHGSQPYNHRPMNLFAPSRCRVVPAGQ